MKKIVVLSGAGISAESGIQTFRDANGLWEGHDVALVATPEGWKKNPELVLEFYNQRRRQLLEVSPNEAHKILVELEKHFDIQIITQNVDDLHERAGSQKVVHLHGELLKVRSSNNPHFILDWKTDLKLSDTDKLGHPLRPHIVWFGEEVPAMQEAIQHTETADILIVIGTSLQVYPAAGLMHYTKPEIPIFYIDPNPLNSINISNPLHIISKKGTEGMVILKEKLLKEYCT
jgi:NAD-dependent deacetylase